MYGQQGCVNEALADHRALSGLVCDGQPPGQLLFIRSSASGDALFGRKLVVFLAHPDQDIVHSLAYPGQDT